MFIVIRRAIDQIRYDIQKLTTSFLQPFSHYELDSTLVLPNALAKGKKTTCIKTYFSGVFIYSLFISVFFLMLESILFFLNHQHHELISVNESRYQCFPQSNLGNW